MIEKEVDPQRMTRKQVILFLGIHPETFDNWSKDTKMPREQTEDMTKPLFNLGDIVKWRIEKEQKKNKPKEPKEPSANNQNSSDSESQLREKILKQDLRKKTIDNDEREGLLVNKKEMEDLFFRMGRAVRDNLMSKSSVWGPQLNMVTGFEATNYIRKESEKLCNSLADLNHISDEALAYEYHEYFVLGFNYAKN